MNTDAKGSTREQLGSTSPAARRCTGVPSRARSLRHRGGETVAGLVFAATW